MNYTPAYNIDDLLVKYLLQEATVSELQEVNAWVEKDDRNRKYFQQFALIWEESRKLSAGAIVDENESWIRFLQKKEPRRPAKIIPIQKPSIWPKVLSAAVLTGVIVMAFIYWPGVHKAKQIAIVSSGTATLTDSLIDGTIVTLNRNSSIAYEKKLSGNTRNVTLKGEAFFNVAPDKNKPFIISVNDVTIKVLGTSFNVKNINGNTEVIVETGIVEVTHKSVKIDLKAKEKILVDTTEDNLKKESSDGNLYNYYRTKLFVCDNTPLWRLVATLNEAYDVRIVIDDPAITNLPLTTTFNEESLDKILSIVSATLNIKVKKQANKIILQ